MGIRNYNVLPLVITTGPDEESIFAADKTYTKERNRAGNNQSFTKKPSAYSISIDSGRFMDFFEIPTDNVSVDLMLMIK